MALALRRALNFYEGTKIIYDVLSRYATLTSELSKQVRAALILKHQSLKKTDLTKQEIDGIMSEDIKFLKGWDTMCFNILLSSLPKGYYIYFKSKYNSVGDMPMNNPKDTGEEE